MKYILKLSQVFLVGWLLNLLWENLHVFLYEHSRDTLFTQIDQLERFIILLRASIFDATFIVVVTAIAVSIPFLKKYRTWFISIAGVIFAIWLEMHALGTGRWAYNSLMPVIPILNVGISPTIQLGLTGYLAYKSTWWA